MAQVSGNFLKFQPVTKVFYIYDLSILHVVCCPFILSKEGTFGKEGRKHAWLEEGGGWGGGLHLQLHDQLGA